MNTIADVRFAISAAFRDIEAKIDVLQNELGLAKKEAAELKAKVEASEKKQEKKKD